MAECVAVGPLQSADGNVVMVVQPAQSPCPGGFVVLGSAELAAMNEKISTAVAQSTAANELPPSADLATVWGVGFMLVVSSFVIGWMVGAVVNFLKSERFI